MRIMQRRHLDAGLIDQLSILGIKPAVFKSLLV